ncbi:hypothetical protein MMC07_000226 [Pseudocyphellaria aurata]|nr:hypothetical protein [Pseudocyphellaria aurata]
MIKYLNNFCPLHLFGHSCALLSCRGTSSEPSRSAACKLAIVEGGGLFDVAARDPSVDGWHDERLFYEIGEPRRQRRKAGGCRRPFLTSRSIWRRPAPNSGGKKIPLERRGKRSDRSRIKKRSLAMRIRSSSAPSQLPVDLGATLNGLVFLANAHFEELRSCAPPSEVTFEKTRHRQVHAQSRYQYHGTVWDPLSDEYKSYWPAIQKLRQSPMEENGHNMNANDRIQELYEGALVTHRRAFTLWRETENFAQEHDGGPHTGVRYDDRAEHSVIRLRVEDNSSSSRTINEGVLRKNPKPSAKTRQIMEMDHVLLETGQRPSYRLVGKTSYIRIRVLIDVGAQILEMYNLNLVKALKAAVFSMPRTSPFVYYRRGHGTLLSASPYADSLSDCLVYFDEAQTRGTDLKMP